MPLEFVVGDEKTLREALLSEGPRTILPEAGVDKIVCEEPLWIVEKPDFELRLFGVELAHRGLEFRSCMPFTLQGFYAHVLAGSGPVDALSITGPDRDDGAAVLADLSLAHGIDGTFDLAHCGSVLARRLTVTESLRSAGHPEGDHSMLSLLNPRAGNRVDIQESVFGCASGRIPRFDSHGAEEDGLTVHSFANCVLYNWVGGAAHTGLAPLALNFCHVYGIPGVDTLARSTLLKAHAPEKQLIYAEGPSILGEPWSPLAAAIEPVDRPLGGFVVPKRLSVFEILEHAGAKHADGTRMEHAVRVCESAIRGARIIDDPSEVGERGR